MVMTNKKWAVKRITVNLAAQEAETLERYCEQTGRPATDIIRELIRGLSSPIHINQTHHTNDFHN
jgi:predicted DNA-binding protein